MRVLLDDNPLAPSNIPPSDFETAYAARPAWIAANRKVEPPEVTAYRLQFSLPQAALIRMHVSADERYWLYLDGQRVGCGPERGSERAWFYETYELDLAAGVRNFDFILSIDEEKNLHKGVLHPAVEARLEDFLDLPLCTINMTVAPEYVGNMYRNYRLLRQLGFNRFNILPVFFQAWKRRQ